ncbi:hypothetical protein [Acetobacter persici]|uniref:Uncharacterized protein n=1 Tax=Acetobacter persici TaxID=1076596 RepID=A0A1U9LIY4_9PROT|nr:hypothetical protein [Acetobacter persici]AQT06250.1 hypothetical protein A0U91_14580 [Acetobacter persici]
MSEHTTLDTASPDRVVECVDMYVPHFPKVDAIFKRAGSLSGNVDIGLLRCGLIAGDHAHEETTDAEAYEREIRQKSHARLSEPAFQGSFLGQTDLQGLALKSPFYYTLNILEVGEEVNRSFGYGLIADQCRRNLKILKREAMALDGIPSEFWGTIPEVYEKQSAELAIERHKARAEKEKRKKLLTKEVLAKDPQALILDRDFVRFDTFSGPDLNMGIFWYATQMAYGRTQIAPIDWNLGLVQDKFERSVKEAISTFKATGLRDSECHVPLMTRLAYRFGLG